MKTIILSFGRGHDIFCDAAVMETPFELGGEKYILVPRCGVLRQWGTTHGLAQIARTGPVDGSTIIDPVDVDHCIPVGAIQRFFRCTPTAAERLEMALKAAEISAFGQNV